MKARAIQRTLLAVGVGLSLLLGGCSKEKPALVVGGIFSITGPASYLGEPEKNTLQMLVDDINAKGGIKGQPVKVVIHDDEANVTKARLAAEKLITNDKAVAIIGPSLTHTSMAVLEVTQKAKVPLISCAAGVGITAPAQDRKWVFKTAQTDQMAVSRIYQYLQKHNLTKLAILTVSTGFGVSGKEQLEAQAPKFGLTIVANEVFGEKDTDMTPQLTKIRGTDAQAVICWGTGPAPALVAKNMKQLGFAIPLIQSHGAASKKFIELAGDAADGIIMPAGKLVVYQQLPDSDPQKKVCQTYEDMYKKKFNAPASSFGGYAYDAMQMLKMAMEKAGADQAKIRDDLENTKNYVGVSGIFNMSPEDHNGLTPEAFVMVKIEGGQFKLID
jgi:branched-chain amino acid transport system substrate-binding protein|uniref:ABC transporter substrate-binding protein n=1 Tax=Desulfobacca acetoxidans TaxID=60893 RepID=A0A7V6A5V5_9BACT